MMMEILDVEQLKIWIPAGVSIITLIVNISFYMFCQPNISFKNKRKEDYVNIANDLLVYLSKLVSFVYFDGALTTIRNYSLKIHLCFSSGTADGKIEMKLEEVYQSVKRRKTMTDPHDIAEWEDEFRNLVRELRKVLAKYSGIL
jgi:hypothetical protein